MPAHSSRRVAPTAEATSRTLQVRFCLLVVAALALAGFSAGLRTDLPRAMADRPRQSAAPEAASRGFACPERDPAGGLPTTVLELLPPRMTLCEQATVRLRIRADCADPPHLVVLVVDRSGSMVGSSIADVKAALALLVDGLMAEDRPSTQVALLSHGSPPTLDVGFSADRARLHAAVAALEVASSDVPDDLPAAIEDARRLLLGMDASAASLRTLVLLSDGGQSHAAPQVLAAADRAQAEGLLIASVCIRNVLSSCPLMQQLASRPDLAFAAGDRSQMVDRLLQVAAALKALVAADLRLRADLPAGLTLVPGSASPPPDADGSWRWPWLPSGGVTVTWQVAALREGTFTFPTPDVTVGAGSGDPLPIAASSGRLEVAGTCGRPTATPTPDPLPEASATALPTTRPAALWLPALLTGGCLRQGGGLDLLLLMDSSNSMGAATRAGRSKMAAAADAARALMTVLGPEDRLGIIAFDASATVIAPLSADFVGTAAALDGMRLSPGTRIDLGLQAARGYLDEVSDRPQSQKVLMLLTDGRTDDGSATAATEVAAALRASGALMRVIGLGDDVDRALLEAIAGDPADLSLTDDGESLPAIYRGIVAVLPCR